MKVRYLLYIYDRNILLITIIMMILRSHEHKKILWKNGGGFTNEIDRYPNNNNEDFDWRLSMATVQYPGGPFSIYPNIDRTLSIIDGENLILTLNNNQLINLNKNSPPYSFSGEIPIICQIHEDFLIDFNIMTKRHKFRHIVQRFILKKDQTPMNISNDNEDIIFILVAQGNLQINQIKITKGDAIKIINNDQSIEISTLDDNTIIYHVQIIKILT